MIVERLAADEIDRLRPLWLGLHAHHQSVAPELAPFVDDDASWRARRPLYEEIHAAGGLILVLRDRGREVGYVSVKRIPSPWPATFVMGEAPAEIETLFVDPVLRSQGLGSRLLGEVDAWTEVAGVTDLVIGVVPANTRAADLYRRRGFDPAWLTLTRFARSKAAPASRPRPELVSTVLADEIDVLQGLWLELHRHHRRIGDGLGPFVNDGDSWGVVRSMLAGAASGGRLLRTGTAAAPSGFLACKVSRDDPMWSDTWQVGPDVAEIAIVVVAEDARGGGLGSALLDAAERSLAAEAVTDLMIGAIEPNTDAVRLYRRRGFQPAWLRLKKRVG